MKFLFKFLIGIVVFIVIIVIAGVILINLTPAQVGIADVELFEGKTIRDIGLADVKFIEMYKFFRSLLKPDESKIVKNGYDAESETPKAEENLGGSSIDEGGTINYAAVLSGEVTYDQKYLLTYDDTTLACILHLMIGDAEDATDNEGVKFLRDIDADCEEISITKSEGKNLLRIVVSVNLSEMKSDVEAQLGSMASFVSLPDKIYLVSYQEITVTNEGLIVCTSKDLRINDMDNAVANAIFSVLASKAGESGEGGDVAVINQKVGEAFAEIVKNLGKVGTADADETTLVISDLSSIAYGAAGVLEHKLMLVTYIESDIA
ncbi:MAG TPA: hypothetical protein P5161_01650 [Eubacteriales bacterium]|jgi:hypothetical protein|nr:hypothetical protein [Eubacteriales bacterium]HRU83913.1 hypothetical protein [Eubacteriales bacterium]